MAVDNKVLAQLADLMNSRNTAESTGTYLMGTVVESEGERMVQIAGSGEVTPVVEAVDVRPGDTVMIFLKNHTATVTNNMTEPASGYTASEVETEIEGFGDRIDAVDDKIDDVDDTITKFMEKYELDKKEIEDQLGGKTTYYETPVVDPATNGTIKYVHDAPKLEESTLVWKYTADAIAMSIDGGKTYPYGFTVTGDMIMAKIVADDITALGITAKDIYVGGTYSDGTYVTYIAEDGSFQFGGKNGIKYNKSTGKITLGDAVEITWDPGETEVNLDGYVKKEDLNSSAYSRPNLVDPDLAKWKMSNSYGSIDYIVEEDDDGNITAEYYELTRTDSSSSYTYLYYDFDAEPNTTYTLSMYVHSLGAGISLVTSNTTINSVARGVVVSEVGRYVRDPLTTSDSTAYGRICISFNSANVARISEVKLEKGNDATDYIDEPVTRGRVTKISKYAIETADLDADRIKTGTLRAINMINATETGDSELQISNGHFRDAGADYMSHNKTLYAGMIEESGVIEFVMDPTRSKVINFINGTSNSQTLAHVLTVRADRITYERSGNSVIMIDLYNDGKDPVLDFSGGNASFGSMNSSSINGILAENYATLSDIPSLDVFSPTVYSASTLDQYLPPNDFYSITGSIKKYSKLGFVVVNIQVRLSDSMTAGQAYTVLSAISDLKPANSTPAALNATMRGTTDRLKKSLNCYINSSGSIELACTTDTSLSGAYIDISGSYLC